MLYTSYEYKDDTTAAICARENHNPSSNCLVLEANGLGGWLNGQRFN